MRVELPIAIAILMMVPGAAWAHDHARGSKHGQEARTGAATDFGRPGVSTKATRTVAIGMDDRMRFYPANLEVKKGETIRFVVRNSGKLYHEMVLGTDKELRKHAEEMRKSPNMHHDSPHMLHVQPGDHGDVVWTFDKAGQFAFACLVPGHLEAGMLGKIAVK